MRRMNAICDLHISCEGTYWWPRISPCKSRKKKRHGSFPRDQGYVSGSDRMSPTPYHVDLVEPMDLSHVTNQQLLQHFADLNAAIEPLTPRLPIEELCLEGNWWEC